VLVDVHQGHVVTAAVSADGVRKLYGQLVAVEDLTFAVESGEILGVLGPNGATLLAPTHSGAGSVSSCCAPTR
jgi:ABC-type lipopolysaccharide export system ATPase subunit